MSIAVRLPGEFVSLETMLESIADAVAGTRERIPDALPDGQPNPQAVGWWGAYMNHETRIRRLLQQRILQGRNALSKDRERDFSDDMAFFVDDLNDCAALRDGLFQFIVDTDASNDERLALLPEPEARRWAKAAPFDETRRTIVRDYSGHKSTTAETLRKFCDEAIDRLQRWRDGKYEIAEAAQVLADQNAGLHAESLCKEMEIAAHLGELVRRVNGLPIQVRTLPYKACAHKTILQKDVNKWLSEKAADYSLEYPYATALLVAPEAPAPASDEVTSANSDGAQGLATPDIAQCFDGVMGRSAGRWRKNLSAAKWAASARVSPGEQGGASARWNPLTLAQLIYGREKNEKEREKVMKTIHGRFNRQPVLVPWRAAFDEYFATHCADD